MKAWNQMTDVLGFIKKAFDFISSILVHGEPK
ncbi:hypothetical protein ACUXLH_002239 [Staphylococcus haemolyticus]